MLPEVTVVVLQVCYFISRFFLFQVCLFKVLIALLHLMAGVLEANFVEPAHDKQGFERTTVLSRLESRLVQMQKTYWCVLFVSVLSFSRVSYTQYTPYSFPGQLYVTKLAMLLGGIRKLLKEVCLMYFFPILIFLFLLRQYLRQPLIRFGALPGDLCSCFFIVISISKKILLQLIRFNAFSADICFLYF